MMLKLKFLEWQKKNLEKALESFRVKFAKSGHRFEKTEVKIILKYEQKIDNLNKKIEVEELKECQE